jgi:tetratricopeptide (TPR) repeat protein
MATHSPGRGHAAQLRGRFTERTVLDQLVEAVRAGKSRALVVAGEPGVGKTALLDYLAGQASGFRVVRATGVQSEMELVFAALQQLCAPMLDHLERLPGPQRDALRTAFGISAGPALDRFGVGMAVLCLLSEVAEDRPLVCLVDDEQWLDRASAQVLAFVARRLAAESVGLIFAARKPTADMAGLPELAVEGLGDADARALLDSVITGPLDERVRDRIIAETHGNPLALLELVRGIPPAKLAGGFGLPGVAPLSGSIEESFRRRVDALPAQTRLLLLVAAADPTGDPGLVWRAAGRLEIDAGAAMLTLDPAQRAGRALAAAQAKVQAGAFGTALTLLGVAEAGPLDELQHARVDLVRAQLAFVSSRGSDAPPLLLKAAGRLEPIDVGLSRATYLDALSAAMFAGRLASPGGGVLDVSRAAGAAPSPRLRRASDLLLDGLAAHFSEGYLAGLPLLRRALSSFGRGMSAEEELRWLWLARIAALHLWDDDGWDALSRRYVRLAREAGAISELPLALSSRAYMLLFAGDLIAAESLVEEVEAATEATGSNLAPYGALGLAALQGREAGASDLIEATRKDVALRGEGIGITVAEWANAVLYNGLGHYQKALAAAQEATDYPGDLGSANWSLVELIEAAARSGARETAAGARRRLAEMTRASGTDWALGVKARSDALLSEGKAAERRYRESIDRLGRTRVRTELARTHLVYGEWLRRERRRARAAAHRPRDAGRYGHRGVRAASPARAGGHRRDRPQAHHGDLRRADRAGGPDRPASPRRPVEPGDRRPAVHQRPCGPVPPGPGLRQAGHQLAQPARPRLAGRPGDHPALARRPAGGARPGRDWPLALCAGGYERGPACLTIAGRQPLTARLPARRRMPPTAEGATS